MNLNKGWLRFLHKVTLTQAMFQTPQGVRFWKPKGSCSSPIGSHRMGRLARESCLHACRAVWQVQGQSCGCLDEGMRCALATCERHLCIWDTVQRRFVQVRCVDVFHPMRWFFFSRGYTTNGQSIYQPVRQHVTICIWLGLSVSQPCFPLTLNQPAVLSAHGL